MMDLQAFKRYLARPSERPVGPKSYKDVLHEAQAMIASAAEDGIEIDKSARQAVLKAVAEDQAGRTTSALQEELYAAYTQLAEQASEVSKRDAGARSFGNALIDAEQLIRYAAEVGTPVDAATSTDIFGARTAFNDGKLTDGDRSKFYVAYAAVAKRFGEVTAETIRNARSKRTRRYLWTYTIGIVFLTLLVAATSIYSFIMDSLSTRIAVAIETGDTLAVTLHSDLKWNETEIGRDYIDRPCQTIGVADANVPKLPGPQELQHLQQFATLLREIRSSAIKLDEWASKFFNRYLECDPYGSTCSDPGHVKIDDAGRREQINPAVTNYPGEVLCKIGSYQELRGFGKNIREDYIEIYGAVASYGLPICYALLGAMAFQLRYFAELIRRRSYHFSFAEPARLVTAIIAGAICGLFNPAKGLNLSPLAIAFLVGYSVEVFFKFLDTLTNAFVPNFQASPSQAIDTVVVADKAPAPIVAAHA